MTMTIINWLIDISLWQYVCFMLSPLVVNFVHYCLTHDKYNND